MIVEINISGERAEVRALVGEMTALLSQRFDHVSSIISGETAVIEATSAKKDDAPIERLSMQEIRPDRSGYFSKWS